MSSLIIAFQSQIIQTQNLAEQIQKKYNSLNEENISIKEKQKYMIENNKRLKQENEDLMKGISQENKNTITKNNLNPFLGETRNHNNLKFLSQKNFSNEIEELNIQIKNSKEEALNWEKKYEEQRQQKTNEKGQNVNISFQKILLDNQKFKQEIRDLTNRISETEKKFSDEKIYNEKLLKEINDLKIQLHQKIDEPNFMNPKFNMTNNDAITKIENFYEKKNSEHFLNNSHIQEKKPFIKTSNNSNDYEKQIPIFLSEKENIQKKTNESKSKNELLKQQIANKNFTDTQRISRRSSFKDQNTDKIQQLAPNAEIEEINKKLKEKLSEKKAENRNLSKKITEIEKEKSNIKNELYKSKRVCETQEKQLNKMRISDSHSDSDSDKQNKISYKTKPLKIKSNPYDIVINIDSLYTKKIGWDIELNNNETPQKNLSSIIGLVGRENVGKTFILNQLCDFFLPSGTNISTKGLSLKYSKDNSLLCLDSAGMQTPVYYYDEKLINRYGFDKETINNDPEIKLQMINDRTLTDVFIQDFILEVCEVILIVVGQLTQNDQKFIERISYKYKAKKKIIIIHNFSNFFEVKDVTEKIQKDIMLAFNTTESCIPSTDLELFIEKKSDKYKENIVHLVLGSENKNSGKKYNKKTFQYLKNILSTRIEKQKFDIIEKLKKFLEDNYRLYFQFNKIPKDKMTLEYDKKKNSLKIQSDQDYKVSNPLFNSLGNLITNPPFEVFVRKHKYVCYIEIPDLKLESLKLAIDKKKTEYNCLVVTGVKNPMKCSDKKCKVITGNRKYGNFLCMIPLEKNFIKVSIEKKNYSEKYFNGILQVDVIIDNDEEEEKL